MRVICNSNSGQALPSRLLSLGYTLQSRFTASVGNEYYVFAIALWQGGIFLLLADDHHLPNWFPMYLFSMSDPCLPDEWSCLPSESDEGGLQALWGYEQLIADATHYEGLLERKPKALRHFYEEEKRRLKLD